MKLTGTEGCDEQYSKIHLELLRVLGVSLVTIKGFLKNHRLTNLCAIRKKKIHQDMPLLENNQLRMVTVTPLT